MNTKNINVYGNLPALSSHSCI